MEWRPISEAPKRSFSGAWIDLWINNGEASYRVCECWWDSHGECWSNVDGRMYSTGDFATHFLEVEPPKD